jgi:hypothetical protein
MQNVYPLYKVGETVTINSIAIGRYGVKGVIVAVTEEYYDPLGRVYVVRLEDGTERRLFSNELE